MQSLNTESQGASFGHPFLYFGLSVVCQINPFFATSLLSPLNPYQESGWGSIFL